MEATWRKVNAGKGEGEKGKENEDGEDGEEEGKEEEKTKRGMQRKLMKRQKTQNELKKSKKTICGVFGIAFLSCRIRSHGSSPKYRMQASNVAPPQDSKDQ